MRTIRWSGCIKFKPWVPAAYWDQPVKTLIIGDSHYGSDEQDATSDFTQRKVEELAIEKPIPFFTRIAAMIEGERLAGNTARKSFWGSIAFYNYLQELAGEKAGLRVSSVRFADSNAAFLEVMRKIQPNLVIVLGHRVWDHMDTTTGAKDDALVASGMDERYLESWRYGAGEHHSALVFHVKHPSRGFNSGKFHPLYLAAFEKAAPPKSSLSHVK